MLTPVALGSNLTMIEPTSPVFGRAVAVKKDTWVRFTGEFIRSEPMASGRATLTLAGSVQNPGVYFWNSLMFDRSIDVLTPLRCLSRLRSRAHLARYAPSPTRIGNSLGSAQA